MAKTEKDYPNGRCCVFQPFDKGAFDKRFEDILAPAIEAAQMEPYRVDRDYGSTIPIDTLHAEIKGAAICLADITTRNPNVMYELGYALAAEKDVVIISAPSAEKYPFDIQHRGIISYDVGSTSDFVLLEQTITKKLNAILERQEKTSSIVAAGPVKARDGLQPHELTALALLLANSDSLEYGISASWLKQEMRRASFSDTGTRIAMARLIKLGYAARETRSDNDERWTEYRLTEAGEGWLVENQDKLEIGGKKSLPHYGGHEITEDDIPF